MNEIRIPIEALRPQLRFEEAIALFPEEEQDFAVECVEKYHALTSIIRQAIRENNSSVYNLVANFSNQAKDSAEKCKLHHLFNGSSLSNEEWKTLPLDVDGIWENFINDEIDPLLEQKAA